MANFGNLWTALENAQLQLEAFLEAHGAAWSDELGRHTFGSREADAQHQSILTLVRAIDVVQSEIEKTLSVPNPPPQQH